MAKVVNAGWDDAPHLSEDEKQRLLATIPPHQIKARTKGIPMLGSGAIYPVDEDDIRVDGFPLVDMMPRGYGLDVGWSATAAVWCALDRGTDTIYVYDCYKRGQAEPAVHISAISQRGDWIPGYIDPASAGASQKDGSRLMDLYGKYLMLDAADNAVEAGIYAVYERMTTGRLKVFSHLSPWFEEFRLYRRDTKGRVVKENDHIMDAMRYCVMGVDTWATQAYGSSMRYRGSV
jgi:hypothetical protein